MHSMFWQWSILRPEAAPNSCWSLEVEEHGNMTAVCSLCALQLHLEKNKLGFFIWSRIMQPHLIVHLQQTADKTCSRSDKKPKITTTHWLQENCLRHLDLLFFHLEESLNPEISRCHSSHLKTQLWKIVFRDFKNPLTLKKRRKEKILSSFHPVMKPFVRWIIRNISVTLCCEVLHHQHHCRTRSLSLSLFLTHIYTAAPKKKTNTGG